MRTFYSKNFYRPMYPYKYSISSISGMWGHKDIVLAGGFIRPTGVMAGCGIPSRGVWRKPGGIFVLTIPFPASPVVC